jgi:hypothetical protein
MGGMTDKILPEAEGRVCILPDCMTSHPTRQYSSLNTVLYMYVMFVKIWFRFARLSRTVYAVHILINGNCW